MQLHYHNMTDADEYKPFLSLVILCYKAETSIVSFVDKIQELFSWIRVDYELILVANYWPNQNDQTPQIVKNISLNKKNIKYVAKEKQGNMGWDLKSGLELASGRYIGFIDGDGQFPIYSLLPLIYLAKTDKYDLAKTYRVLRGDGLYRKLISKSFNFFFNTIFNTNYWDINSKPKIFKNDFYKQLNLKSNDWFIDAEIMIKANQLKATVIETPIHFIENENRASFVKFDAVIEFLKNLIKHKFNL